MEDLVRVPAAVGTECTEPEVEGSTGEDEIGPEADRPGDVGPRADTGVEQDRYLIADLGGDRR